MTELWKTILGHNHEISNMGRVRNSNTKRVLRPTVGIKGYCTIGLYKNGRQYWKYAHRLVAEAFIPNHEDKPTVNHINGKKDDNRAKNLEWCTQSENCIHSYKVLMRNPPMSMLGRFGANNPTSKPVIQMDNAGFFICEYVSIKEASIKTGVMSSDISMCCNRPERHKTAGGYKWKFKHNHGNA